MKALLSILLLVGSAATALAQFAVYDPANHAVNLAVQSAQQSSHIEVLRQWAQQLEFLRRQLRQLEDQLAAQRRIRDVLGDPSAAGVQVVLRELGADKLARQYGETLRTVRRISDAIESLRRTADGIYRELDDRTSLGPVFNRQADLYRRYAAVEQQAESAEQVFAETDARTTALQTELATALVALKDAPTQAEADKLRATIAALNGQLALLAARRRDETDKLLAQHILNENQAAKERQDLLEKQVAEERQSIAVVDAWQKSVRLTPVRYTRP